MADVITGLSDADIDTTWKATDTAPQGDDDATDTGDTGDSDAGDADDDASDSDADATDA